MPRQRIRTFARAALLALAANIPAAGAAELSAPSVDASGLIKLILGLLVVLGAIVAFGVVMRRVGGFTSQLSGQLKVLAALPVGQRERVVLVQVGEKQLLLGVAPGRVQLLHELDQPLAGPDLPPGGAMRNSPFADKLRQLTRPQHEKK